MTSMLNGKTEDTGYFYTTDHNFTTPWKFSLDQPPPTHVVIHIGHVHPSPSRLLFVYWDLIRANDAAQNVSAQAFVKVGSTALIAIALLWSCYLPDVPELYSSIENHLPYRAILCLYTSEHNCWGYFVITVNYSPWQWGWPNPDGTIGQYYEGAYQQIVNTRWVIDFSRSSLCLRAKLCIRSNSIGDNNVFLVNTTGWVTFADVFPEYGRFRTHQMFRF